MLRRRLSVFLAAAATLVGVSVQGASAAEPIICLHNETVTNVTGHEWICLELDV